MPRPTKAEYSNMPPADGDPILRERFKRALAIVRPNQSIPKPEFRITGMTADGVIHGEVTVHVNEGTHPAAQWRILNEAMEKAYDAMSKQMLRLEPKP